MTDDERAKKVEEMTGIDIAQFVRNVCDMDPTDLDGKCIFCKALSAHADGCLWIRIGGVPKEAPPRP